MKKNSFRSPNILKISIKGCLYFLALVLFILSGCKKDPSSVSEQNSTHGKLTHASVSSGNLWYDKFVAYDNSYGSTYYTSSSSATLAWNESYILRSYVIMYELTKNTSWLTKLTTHVDAMLANASDIGSDNYLDWGTTRYGDGGLYPYLVHDGMIALPIARFIRLVDRNPTALSAFATKAATYQTFIETNIVPKWSDSNSYMGNCWYQYSTSTGWYKEPSTFESLPGVNYTRLPYNMMAVFAEMLYTMYDVNGITSYKDRADAIAQNFKNGLTTNGTGYSWKYCYVTSQIEDTSHGNLDMGLAIENFNRAGTITGTHIAGLSNTLTNIMWNQSLTSPIVNDRVDGSSGTHNYTKVLGDWLRLTQFNGTNWKIGAEQFRSYNLTANQEPELYTLAQIMAWDPVKVHNQGFEYKFFSDTTLPARWIRGGGTATEIRRYTGDKYSGQACAAITSSTGDDVWQMLYQDWKEWKPNTTYEITFNVKSSGSNGARIFMQNVTAGTTIGTVHDYTSASWSAQSFTFTTPAAGPVLRLYLENSSKSTDGTAYFDNVVIKQQGDAW